MDRSKGALGASLRVRRLILGAIKSSLKGTITLEADRTHSAHFLPFCNACQATARCRLQLYRAGPSITCAHIASAVWTR